MIERRNNAAVLRARGTDTPNPIGSQVYAADKKIAIGIDVQCAPRWGVGNIDRIHPGESAIGGSAELSAAEIISIRAPGLVLETMSRAIRIVDRKPLFIAAICRLDIRPRLAAVNGAP